MIRTTALALFGLVAFALLQSGEAMSGVPVGRALTTSMVASAANPPGDPVIVAAGDIACDPTNSNFNGGLGSSGSCRMKYTADLIGADTAAVLLLGDNQYYCGGLEAFQQSYDLSWGRVKSITRPAVGNHEYLTSGGTGCTSANSNAEGYFNYFGAAAGEIGKGYYSFDIGAWHLIALNTQCGSAGGCGASSPQGRWLAADLAAHPSMCTLAYWHIPLFSSGGRESSNSRPFWDQLYAAGVDVILTSHDHLYERFGKQDPNGNADPQRGIRQWVVGSGGANHTSFTKTIFPNSEVRDDQTFGVLKMTLHPTSYDWTFVPEAGKTFTDSGTNACHGTSSDTLPPSAPTSLTATAGGPGRVNLAWGASIDNAGISAYRVNRDGAALTSVGGTTTAFEDTTATPGATRTYTVMAFDTGGNPSQLSNAATVATPPDVTPPSAPGALTATASGIAVALAWPPSTDDVGVVGYEVARNGVTLGTVLAPGFTDSTVAPLTAYAYAVRARDASGNASVPATTSITTPAAPTTLTFAPSDDAYVQSDVPTTNFGASTQVVVDSSPLRRGLMKFAVSGVNGRQVLSARLRLTCVDGASVGGTFHRVASSSWSEGAVTWNTQPTFDAAALASLGAVTAGVTYELDVAALVTGDGTFSVGFDSSSTNGAYYSSKEGSAPPQLVLTLSSAAGGDTVKPSAPTNLVATPTSATRVDLAWGASTDNVGVTGYEVRRGGVLLGTVGTTSYADTTVSASTAYAYAVVAKDAAGNASDPSSTASVTTPAPPLVRTFVPVADATVDDSTPTVNAGTSVSLRVDASPLRRSYIRFTVSGVTGPVKKATLRLYANSASTTGYRVGPVADATWGETTITAANAPAIGAAVASSPAHGASMIVEVDVTSLITGNGTYTLGVTTSNSTQINYGSRESSTPPTLVLTLG